LSNTDKKRLTVANFNIVFGENEEPLLKYFDSIIMPALTTQYVKKAGSNQYMFMNIKVQETNKEEYALTGIIVKNTVLEIKSKFNDKGNLIETNELHPSAPYSIFYINLVNHRMTLVKNQKGSPDLKSFSSTLRSYLETYVHLENRKRKEEEKEPLPFPTTEIVGIPMRESIQEVLKKAKKINKLTLRFYPLNGDIDLSGIFEGMTTELRKISGSKTGAVVLNSPTSINGIAELIEAAHGTVEPSFEVTYSNNKVATITNGMLSEKMTISIEQSDINNETKQVIDCSSDIESIKRVSEGNKKIFKEMFHKIAPFVKQS